ncbi:hypothetical protein HMPREF0044_1481 [Gleimia coleocanis DSM 15436]|uniref:DUF559 domain-containing protein n=1 Tax=Gleimia coleocanis DSM 15436 TaxID=525245 RepID=C0W228_9ACTO|nr:hypothetical protein [Gleimia coleocanis]EEH63242.1 hypothetical protein HMPREF0044_1481 [Gleimia coleocanis DSM 15436]
MRTRNFDLDKPHQPSLLHSPSRVLQLAKEVLHRTPSKVALTLYVAAQIYGLPIWSIPQEIQLVYFRQRTFSTTVVGKDKFGNGVTVRRKFRDFPPHAVIFIDKQPLLSLPFLLLDFLTLRNSFAAFVTAEAIFRCLVEARRTPDEAQEIREAYVRGILEYYTRTYISDYYQARVLRRIRLLSAGSESPLESVLHVVMRQLRQTSYTQQFPINTGRTTYYTDGALPRLGTVLEADGQGKYVADPFKLKEKYRAKQIRRLGWQVVRFCTDEFWDPQLVDLVCARLGIARPRWLRKV